MLFFGTWTPGGISLALFALGVSVFLFHLFRIFAIQDGTQQRRNLKMDDGGWLLLVAIIYFSLFAD